MVARRLDGLALRYHLVANRTHLVAGVAVFGAGGVDGAAHFSLVAEGADIVFRVGLAAGAGVGCVALCGAGRSGHGLDEIVGVCLALAAAGADTIFIIMA